MKRFLVSLLVIFSLVPVFGSGRLDKMTRAETIEHPALSLIGPFGPMGPFSELGPIGQSGVSPLGWWNRVLDMGVWSMAPKYLFDWFGPMSGLGPLGKNGLLSAKVIKAWEMQYGAGNVYSVFGPFGPMGVLGPLGPLGPLGAVESKGLKRHKDGYYTDASGKKADRVEVEGREFSIFEGYTTEYATKLGKTHQLDTSFMVRNQLGSQRVHNYGISSSKDQTVFVLVVPLVAMQNVVLKVLNVEGETVAVSDKITMANHLKLQVPKGEKFNVVVESLYGFEDYRLIVVGSDQVLP